MHYPPKQKPRIPITNTNANNDTYQAPNIEPINNYTQRSPQFRIRDGQQRSESLGKMNVINTHQVPLQTTIVVRQIASFSS